MISSMRVPEVVILSGMRLASSRSVWTVGKALPALDTIVSVPHLLHQLPSLPSPTNSRRSSCYSVLTSQALLSGTIERIMPSIVTRWTGDEPIMVFRCEKTIQIVSSPLSCEQYDIKSYFQCSLSGFNESFGFRNDWRNNGDLIHSVL